MPSHRGADRNGFLLDSGFDDGRHGNAAAKQRGPPPLMLGFTEATMRAVTKKTVTAIMQKEQEQRRAEVAKQLNAKVNQEFAAAVDRAVAEEVCTESCAGHACITY